MKKNHRRIWDEVVNWISLLNGPSGPELVTVFHQWLARSSQHERAYASAIATFRLLDGLRRLSPSALRAWLAGASLGMGKVVPFPGGFEEVASPSRRGRSAWIVRGSLVAVMGLILFGALLWVGVVSVGAPDYSTAVGEQKRFRLRDGSVVVLNTDTQVRVRLSEHRRRIELIRGELLIDVGSDPRPLSVVSGGVVIRDIGTRFAVKHVDARTEVVVAEGIVELTHRFLGFKTTELKAGELVSVGIVGQVSAVTSLSPAAIERKLGWEHGQLWFSGETLDTVVAELNRYNRRQIRIVDQDLERVHVGGGVSPIDPEGFVRALQGIGVPISARVVGATEEAHIELYRRTPD